jgi:triphosphatase
LLRASAEVERRAAHHEVEQELGRPALTGLVLGMAAWVEPDETGAPALGGTALGRPLRKLAPPLLDRMARRVAKRGGPTRRCSAEELHDLRKSLKKLRYSADYLASLYPPKPVKHYQKAVTRVLKLLGAVNDATVATGLANRLCSGTRSELTPAAGALTRWSDERRDKALRKLPKAWKKFVAVPPFWR